METNDNLEINDNDALTLEVEDNLNIFEDVETSEDKINIFEEEVEEEVELNVFKSGKTIEEVKPETIEEVKPETIEEVKLETIKTDDELIKTHLNVTETIENVDKTPSIIKVCVSFPKHATPIDCIITATGYCDKISAVGKELRLLQNRQYMIPVDCDETINSDEYNIKVMSDMSDTIDVRYVKNSVACVIPLKHNIKLYQNDRLAILS